MKKWILILCTVLLAGCAEKRYSTTEEFCQKIAIVSNPNWTIYAAPQFNKLLQEEKRRKDDERIHHFRLQPKSFLRIEIYNWPEHARTVTLNERGEFDYIYNICNIKAVGLTFDELRNVLKERLSPFIKDPRIVLSTQMPRTGISWSFPRTEEILFIKNEGSFIPIKVSIGETVFEFLFSQASEPSELFESKFKEVFIIRIDWKTMDLILVGCDIDRFLRMVDLGQDFGLKRHDIIYLPNKVDTENEFQKQLEFLKGLMKKVEAIITCKTFGKFEKKVRNLKNENAAKSYDELLKSLGGK